MRRNDSQWNKKEIKRLRKERGRAHTINVIGPKVLTSECNLRAITSGRFDPPHLGHYLTIDKIAKEFPDLKVFVLDYPGRRFPVSYIKEIFEELFEGTNVKIIINKIHFGKIEKWQIERFDKMYKSPFDIYCGGNLVVLRHLEEMGVKTKYFDREYQFAASEYSDPNG